MKKALFTAYDIDGIVRQENELKKLQDEANRLESENVSLNKVKMANEKAMKELDADSNMRGRFKKTKSSLADLKTELKEQQEFLRAEEKQVKEDHATIIEMEEKCRKLSQLMRMHNRGQEVETTPTVEVNDNDLDT